MGVNFDDLQVGATYYSEQRENEEGDSYQVHILGENDDGYDAEFELGGSGFLSRSWWNQYTDWTREN